MLTPSSVQGDKKVIEQKEFLPKEFEGNITLRAVNLPLSLILKSVGKAVHHNVILGPGVEDKVMSINVVEVSVERALNTLLYSAGYGFRARNNDLIILSQETRIFRIVLPPVTQQFNDVTSNESFVQSNDDSSASNNGHNANQQIKLGTKILVENSAQGISFWDDVRDNLKTLLSKTGQFSVNKPAGAVIVTDTPPYLERISQYFDDLNRRVTQQIEVDVKVMEVVLNDENRFGVDWNVLSKELGDLGKIGMASNFTSGNFTGGQLFTFNTDGERFKLAIDALSKQGKVEVVSQPKVTILNNQVAVIQVGSTQSFVDRTTLETTQTGTITSISTSQVQEGVTMRLVGNIVGDQIYLSVAPVVTTIDNIRSITSGNTKIEAPQTTTKSINTLVKLNEGQTVAIGGLITSHNEKSKQGVPGISKIPLLGKLFEYVQEKNSKTELVIFITPKRG